MTVSVFCCVERLSSCLDNVNRKYHFLTQASPAYYEENTSKMEAVSVEQLREMFDSFDENGDGVISMEEFSKAFRTW